MGTIEEIANASEIAVEEVMTHIGEILGDSYRFEGIHIQVSKKDGRMLNFTLNDERVKDVLFVLSKQLISLAHDITRISIQDMKPIEPKPYKPSALTGRTNVGVASSDLHRIEQRIMAKMEEKITAAITQVQMSQNHTEIDPKDYNKHLFGKTP